MNAVNRDQIEFLFENKEISTQQIYEWFAQGDPQIPKATVNWRIYEMVRKGQLVRVGKGRFRTWHGGPSNWVATEGSAVIVRILAEEFPLATSCLWSTQNLAEFEQHLTSTPFTVVEVERAALTGVYYRIKEVIPDTFLEPEQKLVEEYLIGRVGAVVVKPLVTESPLSGNRPTLEKILVDLVADRELFYFLQGTELHTIYQNATAKYAIQLDRLLRYATRRNRRNEVNQLLKPLGEWP
jgi:hypothetical protein